MRSSWNFSTAIFEIWVLVLTKPGWANETPTTSLKRVPRENFHHHHHNLQHEHHHHHYSLAASTSRGGGYSGNSHHHHQHSSSSSLYTSLYSQHLDSASSSSSSSSLSLFNNPLRCYVCLPPNKNSREAKQILDIFAKEVRPLIPDCSAFDPYVDAGRFEFDCPPKYGGCILRIHGSNVSRACSRYRMSDCKKANSVEFCYCTTSLCNDKKPEPAIIPAVVQSVRNDGDKRRGNGNTRARSSLRSPDDGGNSQGIRSRGSDDDDNLNPVYGENDDEDDLNGGSGTGPPGQHLQTLIDPFTSTMDPTIFQEKNLAIPVEDPNPHTKIGIAMSGSTSRGSRLSTSIIPSLTQPQSLSAKSIFHLFVHFPKTLVVRLFAEQVVDDYHYHHHQGKEEDNGGAGDSHFYTSQQKNGDEIVEDIASFSLFFNQLCFTISLVVLQALFS